MDKTARDTGLRSDAALLLNLLIGRDPCLPGHYDRLGCGQGPSYLLLGYCTTLGRTIRSDSDTFPQPTSICCRAPFLHTISLFAYAFQLPMRQGNIVIRAIREADKTSLSDAARHLALDPHATCVEPISKSCRKNFHRDIWEVGMGEKRNVPAYYLGRSTLYSTGGWKENMKCLHQERENDSERIGEIKTLKKLIFYL